MLLRAIVIGLLIAVAEVLNGNLRVRYLQRKYGRKKGKLISFLLGVLTFSVIAWFCLPWINPRQVSDCLLIGSVWVLVMTTLDLYFGRYVFRLSWKKILDDFNPMKGNPLGVGMLLLFLCPTVVFLLR